MSGSLSPFHTHGGRLGAAWEAFGGTDWIDLSTGIAPWAWPVGELDLALDRLPEPEELAALEAAAGSAFGLPEERAAVAVPGTDLALRLLAHLIGARSPAVVRPGYAGHAAAWPDAVAIRAEWIEAAAGQHDLIVLASPANPDGRVLDPAMAERIVGRAMLLVDEAYADPGPGFSAMPWDGLVTLRSFGKFYGLPGLRLGFVIAPRPLAGRLRAMLGDWPVSMPAIAIGTAAYRDGAWREAQAGRIARQSAALDDLLAKAGLAVVGGTPLFRFAACDDAERLFRHLAERAILTRPFAGRPDRLRIGLPRDGEGLARLAAALREFRA